LRNKFKKVGRLCQEEKWWCHLDFIPDLERSSEILSEISDDLPSHKRYPSDQVEKFLEM
jgi:hypothetical protein